MKFGIVLFPGSNCDWDTYHAVRTVLGEDATFLWHQDTQFQNS
jgi:phosphoribosylformylglycinamidine synthase